MIDRVTEYGRCSQCRWGTPYRSTRFPTRLGANWESFFPHRPVAIPGGVRSGEESHRGGQPGHLLRRDEATGNALPDLPGEETLPAV